MFAKGSWRTSGAYLDVIMGIWGWIICGLIKGGGLMKGGGWIEVWGRVEDVGWIVGEDWVEDGVWVSWWEIIVVGLDDLVWTNWYEADETAKEVKENSSIDFWMYSSCIDRLRPETKYCNLSKYWRIWISGSGWAECTSNE